MAYMIDDTGCLHMYFVSFVGKIRTVCSRALLNASCVPFRRVSGLAIHGLIGLSILKLRPQLAQVSRPVA